MMDAIGRPAAAGCQSCSRIALTGFVLNCLPSG